MIFQIFITSEVLISTLILQKMTKAQFYRKIGDDFILFSRKCVNWCI